MYSFKDILKLSFNIITLIIKMEMLQIFDWLEILFIFIFYLYNF